MAPGQSQQNMMKGLQLFIADLRATQNAKDHDMRIQTELSNIRKQFGQKNGLNGYQRKKYVAKLAYIYITTNTSMMPELLFGREQCMKLLESNSFNEKWIGYMTLELLMGDAPTDEEVEKNLIRILKKDLDSNDENVVCLALNFFAVAGNRRATMSEQLNQVIFGLLRSPASSGIIKRKSSLAFLVAIRKEPRIFSDLDEKKRTLWVERITSLLGEDEDEGFLVSLLPLIEFIAKEVDVRPCLRLIPQLTEILVECFSKSDNSSSVSTTGDQLSTLNPWLISKCASLLDVLIYDDGSNLTGSQIDQKTIGKLRICVSKAINLNVELPSDYPMKNIQHVILFKILGLACKLDPSSEAVSNAVSGLCRIVDSKDINVKYSALDLLCKVCRVNGDSAKNSIEKSHMDQFFKMLDQESDAILLKKVVDLIVLLTKQSNFTMIVAVLLKSLEMNKIPDKKLREFLTLKIEAIMEQYAEDLNWFVLTSLRLLSLRSSTKDDQVWKRICQIVVNNDSLHRLTCENLLKYLKVTECSESLVKTAAFLLGEYCTTIIDIISVGDLFNIFAEKYFHVGNMSKTMILTTMLKLYHTEPRITSAVVKFFQLELNSFDLLLQTRSYEYLKIIQYSKMNGMKFADQLLPGMPPFTGRKELNPKEHALVGLNFNESDSKTLVSTGKQTTIMPAVPPSRKKASLYHSQQLTPNWETGYKRMIMHKSGVFYQDSLVRILYRSERSNESPFMTLFSFTIVNQSNWDISGLSCELIPFRVDNNPEYIMQVLESPPLKVAKTGGRSTFSFEATARFPFSSDHSPLLSLQFRCGGSYSALRLKIGYTMISTLSTNSGSVSLEQFIKRWKYIGESIGKEGEYIVALKNANIDMSKLPVLFSRMGFDIVEQTSVFNTLFLAGVIHTKSDSNFGCLIKVRQQEDKSIEIICKTTTTGELSKFIVNSIKLIF